MSRNRVDPLYGVQFERFRVAYRRVVAASGASAAEMAVAMGASTKTLDNWRAEPPKVADIPFAAIVRMAVLAQMPLSWFAGVGSASFGETEPLEVDRSAVTAPQSREMVVDLTRFARRRLDVLLGDEAELAEVTRTTAKTSRANGTTRRRRGARTA